MVRVHELLEFDFLAEARAGVERGSAVFRAKGGIKAHRLSSGSLCLLDASLAGKGKRQRDMHRGRVAVGVKRLLGPYKILSSSLSSRTPSVRGFHGFSAGGLAGRPINRRGKGSLGGGKVINPRASGYQGVVGVPHFGLQFNAPLGLRRWPRRFIVDAYVVQWVDTW